MVIDCKHAPLQPPSSTRRVLEWTCRFLEWHTTRAAADLALIIAIHNDFNIYSH